MKGAGRVRGARAYRGLQDAQLAALVAERDGGALDGLYDRYGAGVYALARRILGDDDLAQETTRDAFLALWREAGGTGGGHDTVGDHLLALTRRRALATVRGNETLRRRQAAVGQLAFHVDAPTNPVPDDGHDRVRRALAALPEEQREALALAYFGGYTQREIAALVGVQLATVKSLMATAMRQLQEALVADGHEEPSPWTPR